MSTVDVDHDNVALGTLLSVLIYIYVWSCKTPDGLDSVASVAVLTTESLRLEQALHAWQVMQLLRWTLNTTPVLATSLHASA